MPGSIGPWASSAICRRSGAWIVTRCAAGSGAPWSAPSSSVCWPHWSGAVNRGPAGVAIGAISGLLAGIMLGAVIGGLWGRLRRQQARATLTIEIAPANGQIAPGDRLSGHLQVAADNAFRTEGGTVYLVCRGAFTHDAMGPDGDTPTFERRLEEYLVEPLPVVAPGALRAQSTIRYPFAFTVPPTALPSHQGYGCAIQWSLYATLSAPGTELIAAQRELLVEAPPPPVDKPGRGYQTTATAAICQLELHLPPRRLRRRRPGLRPGTDRHSGKL